MIGRHIESRRARIASVLVRLGSPGISSNQNLYAPIRLEYFERSGLLLIRHASVKVDKAYTESAQKGAKNLTRHDILRED